MPFKKYKNKRNHSSRFNNNRALRNVYYSEMEWWYKLKKMLEKIYTYDTCRNNKEVERIRRIHKSTTLSQWKWNKWTSNSFYRIWLSIRHFEVAAFIVQHNQEQWDRIQEIIPFRWTVLTALSKSHFLLIFCLALDNLHGAAFLWRTIIHSTVECTYILDVRCELMGLALHYVHNSIVFHFRYSLCSLFVAVATSYLIFNEKNWIYRNEWTTERKFI